MLSILSYSALGICVSSALDIDVAEQTSQSSSFRPLTSSTKLTPENTYFVRIIQQDGSPFTSFSLKASNPSTLGAKEIENKGVLMYPNPTQNQLFFSTTSQVDAVQIFDLSGKELKRTKPKNNAVSVSTLPKGLYMITVSTQEKTQTLRFIKE